MQCLWCLIDEIKRPTRAPVCLGDRKISEMVIAGIPGGLTCIWVRERLSGGSAERARCLGIDILEVGVPFVARHGEFFTHHIPPRARRSQN
jgi:hypothetical protein